MVFLGGKSSSSSEKTKSEWVCTSFTTPSYLKSEDKADKLLSAEFQPSLEELIPFLPQNRQFLMYSLHLLSL
ncbi:unnamed protein product [Brassica rapa subsp. trilocularis]